VFRPRRIELLSNSPPDAPGWRWSASACEAFVVGDAGTGGSGAFGGDGRTHRTWDDLLGGLRHIESVGPSDFPNADGRWVGYIGYDLGRAFEHLPAAPAADLGLPTYAFALAGHTPAGDPRVAPGTPPPARAAPAGGLTSTFARAGYMAAVARAIEYIRAGDVFQVNLSQRLTVPWPHPPAGLFRRLQELGGARYGGLLDFGSFALVSNSPDQGDPPPPAGDGRGA
jgi:anthranilate/para-aminobenzoate synthase component I